MSTDTSKAWIQMHRIMVLTSHWAQSVYSSQSKHETPEPPAKYFINSQSSSAISSFHISLSVHKTCGKLNLIWCITREARLSHSSSCWILIKSLSLHSSDATGLPWNFARWSINTIFTPFYWRAHFFSWFHHKKVKFNNCQSAYRSSYI